MAKIESGVLVKVDNDDICNGTYLIPQEVTAIGDGAFFDCSSLISVIIPEGVAAIGYGAFYDCSNLTSVTLHERLSTIGAKAFLRCRSLISVIIPGGVTAIGYGTFCDCSNLTSVTISRGVTTIGDRAFLRCRSLISVIIPEGVTAIGDGAFFNCPAVLFCNDSELARFTSLYPEGSWIPAFQTFEVSTRLFVCKDKYYEDLCEHYPNIYWIRESMHNKRDKELFDGFARTKPWCQIKGLPTDVVSQVVRYSTEETLGLRFATMKAKLHSLPLYASGGRMERYNRRMNATIDFCVAQVNCVFKLRTYVALAEQVLPKDYSTRTTNRQDNKAIVERMLALKWLIARLEALPLNRRLALSPKTIGQFHDSEKIESILQAYPKQITL